MNRRSLLILVAALAAALTSITNAGATGVVMSGLDNPRGLAFGPQGALYVAEAGRGGPGPCIVLRGAPQCYGPTGAVSRLWRGQQERVATGLPSYGSEASTTGPHDISFQGLGGGYVTLGLGFEGQPRSALGEFGYELGWLVRLPASGRWRNDVDVAAYEFAQNPGGGPLDSNPYGVLAEAGGEVVTDAGANSLLRVAPNGEISTLATFPSRPQGRETDAVPTAVAVGPDGAYYVSELTRHPVRGRRLEDLPRRTGGSADGRLERVHDRYRPRVRPGREPLRPGALDRAGLLRPAGQAAQARSGRDADDCHRRPHPARVGCARSGRRALHLQPQHIDRNRRGPACRPVTTSRRNVS